MRFLFAILALLLVVSPASALVVSISQASIDQSGYGKIDGQAFIAEWRSAPTSTDKLEIIFNSATVSKATGDAVVVENPVEVELYSSEYSAAYTFSNPKPVYNVDYVTGYLGTTLLRSTCAERVAEHLGDTYAVVYREQHQIEWNLQCHYWAYVGANLEGYVSNVNFAQREFSNTWIINRNGAASAALTLSSKKNGKTVLSQWYDDKLFMQYTGSVQWLFNEPNSALVKAFYDKKTNKWQIVNEDAAADMSSVYSVLPNSNPYADRSLASPDKVFDDAVGRLRTSALPNEWTGASIVKKEVTGTSENDGFLRVFLTGSVSVPTFKIIADASWMGIKTTAGKPEIVSASAVMFNEGNVGISSVVVKNSGSGKGGFTLEARCSDGFSGSVQTFNLEEGETRTVTLEVVGKNPGSLQTVSGNCEVVMQEQNTGEQDTASFSVSMKSLQSCIPGEQQAAKDTSGLWVIRECEGDGQTFKTVKVCDPAEIVQRSTSSGNLECFLPENAQTDEGGDGEFNPTLLIVSSVIALVAGGFAAAGVGRVARKAKKAAPWLVGATFVIVTVGVLLFAGWAAQGVKSLFTLAIGG